MSVVFIGVSLVPDTEFDAQQAWNEYLSAKLYEEKKTLKIKVICKNGNLT